MVGNKPLLARLALITMLAIIGSSDFAVPDAYAVPDGEKGKKEKKQKKKEKDKKPGPSDDVAPVGVSIESIKPVDGDFVPVCAATTESKVIHIFNLYKGKKGLFSIKSDSPAEEDTSYTVSTAETDPAQAQLSYVQSAPEFKPQSIEIALKRGFDTSEPFYLRATQIDQGQGEVQVKRNGINPETDNPYPEWTIPVNVWEFDTIVDYNAVGEGDVCYDPTNSPALKSGAAKTSCGLTPDFVATDGTSRLLMRLKSSMAGQACFKVVEDGENDMGTTDPADSSAIASAGDLADPYWAFGTYLPPNAFGSLPQKVRDVEVEIAFTPSVGTALSNTLAVRRTMKVQRPPVLLVHGVWSNQDTWSDQYKEPADRLRDIHLMEYGKYAKQDTSASDFEVNIPKLGKHIRKIVTDARKNEKTAITQVDVVAHSMGGLLTRGWTERDTATEQYRTAQNFRMGDVHRIISLSTPYTGSQFANLLINALHSYGPDETFDIWEWDYDWDREVLNHYSPVGTLMKYASRFLKGSLKEGAVCDLAENSPALPTLGASDVEARAYTASGGSIGELLFPLDYFDDGFSETMHQTHIQPYLFAVPNDGVVAQDSQSATPPGQTELAIPGEDDASLVHFHRRFVPFVRDGITYSALVAAKVYEDLDSVDGRFGPLPAVASSGLGEPRLGIGRGEAIDRESYNIQCCPGCPMNPTAQPTP